MRSKASTIVALSLTLIGHASCTSYQFATVQDNEPYHLALTVGTEWEYQKLPLWPVGVFSPVEDTLTVRVTASAPSPRKQVVRLGPLIPRWFRELPKGPLDPADFPPRGFRPSMPRSGYSVKGDSLFRGESPVILTTTINETVYQIFASMVSPGRIFPAYWANSSAGLVRFDEFRGPYGDPKPVYNYRNSDEGSLIVFSPHSDIRSFWWAPGHGWYISNPDTTVIVPAGTFNCFVITRWTDVYNPTNEWQEYWSPEIGLIGWTDYRASGGNWALAEYRRR